MKKYLAIVAVKNNKVSRCNDFDTQAEADALIAKKGKGFVVLTPGNRYEHIIVDEVNKTATYDQTQADKDDADFIIKSKIKKLENLETPRRLAEALPDEAGGSLAGRQWLKANRDAIATERGKL